MAREAIPWAKPNPIWRRISNVALFSTNSAQTDYFWLEMDCTCFGRERGCTLSKATLGASSQVLNRRSASILSAHPARVNVDRTWDKRTANAAPSPFAVIDVSSANSSTVEPASLRKQLDGQGVIERSSWDSGFALS
jgi:hypothetical protein